MIHIRNPHSVLAVLQTRPRDVQQIIVPQGLAAGSERGGPADAWGKVVQLAKELRVPVSGAPKGQPGKPLKGVGRDSRATSHGEEGGRTSVTEAIVTERQPVSVEELFENAPERAAGKGLWLALDSLQDPQNIGAIFRAAAFFGVQGILLTQERSAPLTGTVYDVACGGVEYVPFSMGMNLQRAFEVAKDSGLWILGTSEHAKQDFNKVERDRPWLLVLGNEEKGMRRLTEEACDVLCAIPPVGKVTSLNVSVAAGIFISRLAGG